MAAIEHTDVLVIGAGISGVNAGYRLKTETPHLSYTILEARDSMGGTWDLFKYPGIRSDSDLHTFGFSWRPWADPQTIADGRKIVEYIRECATEFGIDKHIRYRHKVTSADWSSSKKEWTLQVTADEKEKTYVAKWVIFSTGYYNYDSPLEAKIPGIENFKGEVIHPQFWPTDPSWSYKNKKIVVIGSGATAITLLPNLAEEAASVTMLQRSPGYVISLPTVDPLGQWAHRWLPKWLAFKLVRWKFLILPFLFFQFCRQAPKQARAALAKRTKSLIPNNLSFSPNFEPRYNPWEQRLCVCPDADYYKCLKSGKATIVTGNIDNVSETTITTREGASLKPDIIVTATGLRIQLAGGARVSVDGQHIDLASKFLWKGVMLQDLPNAAIVLGYTNASWTLGADATAFFVTRMLKKLESGKVKSVVPRLAHPEKLKSQSPFNLNSTYIEKAKGEMPKAGDKGPWRARSNYMQDLWIAKHGGLEALEFEK